MRRIFLILILVAVVGVAGYLLFRPKREIRPTRGTTENGEVEGKRPKRRGGTKIRIQSRAETKAERKRVRHEARLRRREQKQRERDMRRQMRTARTRRSRRSGQRGSKGQAYAVSAIVSLGTDSYALVDGRRVTVGDVIMGRRIVEITPDRVAIEAFGRRSNVRVGQSIVPMTGSQRRSRRR